MLYLLKVQPFLSYVREKAVDLKTWTLSETVVYLEVYLLFFNALPNSFMKKRFSNVSAVIPKTH